MLLCYAATRLVARQNVHHQALRKRSAHSYLLPGNYGLRLTYGWRHTCRLSSAALATMQSPWALRPLYTFLLISCCPRRECRFGRSVVKKCDSRLGNRMHPLELTLRIHVHMRYVCALFSRHLQQLGSTQKPHKRRSCQLTPQHEQRIEIRANITVSQWLAGGPENTQRP